MNLYIVNQDEESGYDTYSEMIVAAENEEQAKRMSPCEFREWDDDYESWVFIYATGERRQDHRTDWANGLKSINVELIGVTEKYAKPTVVIASFHAG